MTTLVLFIAIPINLASATENIKYSEKGLQIGDITQYYEETESEDGAKLSITTIVNNKTKDVLRIEISKQSNNRTIKVFLNDELDHTVIRDDSSNKMVFVDSDGTKEIYDVSNFVKQIDEESEQPQVLRDTPSYPLLQSKYSSAWEVWGYLYGDDSTTYGTTYMLEYSAGTAIGLIVGALPAIFSGQIGAVVYALGASIVGSIIDAAIDGKTKTRDYRWDYEVFCQGELGLVSYTVDTDAWVYDNNTHQASYVDLVETGDERSRSEMIDAGIYFVMVN